MHGRPEELIKTDHRMRHNQANHKQAKHYKMCCDFWWYAISDHSPSSGVLPSRQHLWDAIYIRGRCPRLLTVVPSRHQSACGVFFSTDWTDKTDIFWTLEPLNFLNLFLGARQKPEKPLGEDGGRYPAVMHPLWSYKSELLTTKSEAYQHLH